MTSAALLFSIPFSTALGSILSGLILLIWVISGQVSQLPALLKNNIVGGFCTILFFALFVGISYSSADTAEAFNTLKKYHEYLLVVFIIPFLQDEQAKSRMFQAFVWSACIMLMLSYAQAAGLVPLNKLDSASIGSSITHSLIISFFAYYCLYQLASSEKNHWFYVVALVVSLHNIYFIIDSRTGQLLFLLLAILFVFQQLKKWRLIFSIILMLLFSIYAQSTQNGKRLIELLHQLNEDTASLALDNSTNMRLRFWHNSVQLIKQSPWTGYGTGSFPKEYAELAAGDAVLTDNPHNEYFMHIIQLGVSGLLLYIGLMCAMWWCSRQLDAQQRFFAQALLLTIAVDSIFASIFLDHAEGHWFACMIALAFATCQKQPINDA